MAEGRETSNPSGVMPLTAHLEDLRRRIIFALAGLVPIFIVSLVFADDVLSLLLVPVRRQLANVGQAPMLQATGPLESFIAWLQVGLVCAVLVAFPWVIYQLWKFVSPGLYARERRFVYVLIPMSGVLTSAAAAFLYFVLLPVSLYFLIAFGAGLVEGTTPVATVPEGAVFQSFPMLAGDPPDEAIAPGNAWVNTHLQQLRVRLDDGRTLGSPLMTTAGIAQQYRIGEYINLVFWLGVVFAAAFQLPLVMLLLGWTGLVKPANLTRFRKQIFFGCAIAGAMLTPQDPYSMVLLGGALYVLFELGILLMRFVPVSLIAGAQEEAK